MSSADDTVDFERTRARAEALIQQGAAGAALEILQARQDEFRRSAPGELYARCRKLIGVCLQLSGDMAGAYTTYQSILALPPSAASPALKADVFNNLGMLLAHLDRHDEALAHYQMSMQTDPAPPGDPGRAMTHNNIGLLLCEMGLPLEGLRQFRASLAIKTAAGDRRGEANTLDNIGALLLDVGRVRPAAACFRRALELRRDFDDLAAQASSHFHLGLLALHGGDNKLALTRFERALAMDGGAGEPRQYLAMQSAAATAAIGPAGIERAAALLHSVIRRADELGVLSIAIENLGVLEHAWARAGNFRAALEAAEHRRAREERQDSMARGSAARKRHFNAAIAAQRTEAALSARRLRALQRKERSLLAQKQGLERALHQRETLLQVFRRDLRQPIDELSRLSVGLHQENQADQVRNLAALEQICRDIQDRIHSLLSDATSPSRRAETPRVGIDQLLRDVAGQAAAQHGITLELVGLPHGSRELLLYQGDTEDIRRLLELALTDAARRGETGVRAAVADGFLYVLGAFHPRRAAAGDLHADSIQTELMAVAERLGARVVLGRRGGTDDAALAVPLYPAAGGPSVGRTKVS